MTRLLYSCLWETISAVSKIKDTNSSSSLFVKYLCPLLLPLITFLDTWSYSVDLGITYCSAACLIDMPSLMALHGNSKSLNVQILYFVSQVEDFGIVDVEQNTCSRK